MRYVTKNSLLCGFFLLMSSSAFADMRDAEVAKQALWQCVAHRIKYLDDGISPANVVAGAAVKLCQKEVDKAAAAMAEALHEPAAGAGIREGVMDGSAFVILVLEWRAAHMPANNH